MTKLLKVYISSYIYNITFINIWKIFETTTVLAKIIIYSIKVTCNKSLSYYLINKYTQLVLKCMIY